MDWIEIAVFCPPIATEAVLGLIEDVTSRSSVIEEAGPMRKVSAYCRPDDEPDRMLGELRVRLLNVPEFLSEGNTLEPLSRIVEEEDWAEAWKDYYHPMRVGQRIVIKPSWEPWPPAGELDAAREDDVVIDLDPGMAFGTGDHPTTRLILCATEDLMRPGAAVFDVGCGSGILSLAAALLGAGTVLAVDVDPVAVEVAAKNVEIAGLSDQICVIRGDVTAEHDGEFDLVLANINAPIVRDIAGAVAGRLKPGGYYVTTGFTEQWVDDVTTAVAAAGLHVADTREEENWNCIIGRRPDREQSG